MTTEGNIMGDYVVDATEFLGLRAKELGELVNRARNDLDAQREKCAQMETALQVLADDHSLILQALDVVQTGQKKILLTQEGPGLRSETRQGIATAFGKASDRNR